MNNRLQNEKSLYLQQHAKQPIDWYPYGPEALQKAQDENKPLFISIGYSSCHWCHRMAHDCFHQEDIADFLNKNFISIKIDREEYPDVDHYYQQACQIYTQSGGWPLSVFALHDMRPFFAGTYFPPYTFEEQTGFLDVCHEMLRAYQEEYERVEQNAAEADRQIKEGFVPKDKVEFEGHFPHPMSILDATKEFQDREFGGHGESIKFPNFPFLEWAIEQMLEGMIEKEQGDQIIKTIDGILLGGIYDQVRGGIHRYSVDRQWRVPHFEKMLYDQAGLLSLLAKTALIYPAPHVYDSIIQTLDYLEKEMLSSDNYFFSAQDADSEGEEGFYFGFTAEEFEQTLIKYDPEDELFTKNLDNIKQWFQITTKGDYGPNLNTIKLDPKLKDKILTQHRWEIIRKVKEALAEERKLRIPPATDTKGVASWNFMVSSALADVVQYCPIVAIKQNASDLLQKVLEGQFKTFFLNQQEQQIFKINHTTTISTGIDYFEDYAAFCQLQLRVYELTGNNIFRDNALQTAEFIKKQFLEQPIFLTRSKLQTEHLRHPNQAVDFFDSSFRSLAATFLSAMRRLAILELDNDLLQDLTTCYEYMTHQILKNPINAGEALRALTYPNEAYRVVKVPKHWPTNPQFSTFMPYFLPRFVIRYEDSREKWQICTLKSCELQGEGIENFIKTLSPTESEKE